MPAVNIENMDTFLRNPSRKKYISTSTVGRGRAVKEITTSEMTLKTWSDEFISVQLGDSLEYYQQWNAPTVIVSDGGYGGMALS